MTFFETLGRRFRSSRWEMETSTQIEQFSRATAIAARSNHHYKIHIHTELRQQIHDNLRIQHPEWKQPWSNGGADERKSSPLNFNPVIRKSGRRFVFWC